MKKFICISNFQIPDRFEAGVYAPIDNESLGYDRAVHYVVKKENNKLVLTKR